MAVLLELGLPRLHRPHSYEYKYPPPSPTSLFSITYTTPASLSTSILQQLHQTTNNLLQIAPNPQTLTLKLSQWVRITPTLLHVPPLLFSPRSPLTLSFAHRSRMFMQLRHLVCLPFRPMHLQINLVRMPPPAVCC